LEYTYFSNSINKVFNKKKRPGANFFYYVLYVCFPLLRLFIKKLNQNPCLWKTCYRFNSLSKSKKEKARINVLIDIETYKIDWGHCWLTIEGIEQKKHLLKSKIEKLANSDNINYWMVISKGYI
jgi:hypothetical protein